jgi:hypothetical protein
MSTDDRDTESSNPSKSFKVGEVDRLSGFFTPVWESKRRLRSESRPPSSSSGVPSSARGADKNSRPSTPPSAPPSRRKGGAASSGSASTLSPSTAALAASPAESAPSASPSPPEPPAVAPPTQREDGGGAVAYPTATRPVAPASAKALAPTNDASTSSSAAPAAAEGPELSAADAAEGRIAAGAQLAAALAAAAAVTVRPVIPMPSTPGRLPPRPKAPSTPPPGAASASPKQAGGPDLEPGELVHREPALLQPAAAVPRLGSGPEVQRSARVTAAATSLHDRLKSKVPIDSVDTFARHRETESEREALQAAAARAALTPSDPYPGHVLRTLRRTIHLSTPLPDDVRQMLEKYRH